MDWFVGSWKPKDPLDKPAGFPKTNSRIFLFGSYILQAPIPSDSARWTYTPTKSHRLARWILRLPTTKQPCPFYLHTHKIPLACPVDLSASHYQAAANRFAQQAAGATGAIYVGGAFQGTANFPTGTLVSSAYVPSTSGFSTLTDGVVAKLDSDGNWLWTKAIYGNSTVFLRDLIIGPDQQLYVSGEFEGTANLDGNTIVSKGKTDFLVAKVDSATGNVSWAQRMGGTDLEQTGGKLAFDLQGNLNIAGTFRGTADFGSQSLTADGPRGNAFLSKLTAMGSFLDSHRVAFIAADRTVESNPLSP